MTATIALFYISLSGMLIMLFRRMFRSETSMSSEVPSIEPQLADIGVTVVAKITSAKHTVLQQFKVWVLVGTKHALDRLFELYRRGGLWLFRAKERIHKLSRERKLSSSGVASSYIKSVLHYKENMRKKIEVKEEGENIV